jgi:hypothetical protein
MLKTFFIGKIKTRGSPMPIYCGCYAWKVKNPHYGHFICARMNGSFLLMIVSSFEHQICSAFDPTNIADGIKLISLVEEDWTPLPTVIPDRPLGRWEHSKDAVVLSLWNETGSDDGWSTEFFTAKVVARPSDRAGESERGYLLNFCESVNERDAVRIVPEQFVVGFPNEWKKKV